MLHVTTTSMAGIIGEFEQYLRDERMRAPRTVQRYREVLEAFSTSVVGSGVDIEAMNKTTLTAFLRDRARSSNGPSRATWNTELSALRAFYAFLYGQERIKANPALRVERQKTLTREAQPLSLDEFLRLVDAMGESQPAYRARNVALALVLFHTAMRVAELVSLNVDQTDLEARVFRDVRVKGQKRHGIAFNDVVCEALEDYREERLRYAPEGEPALFISDRRTRLSVRMVQETVKRAAKRAGIARAVTPHLLRHSSATQLVEMGVPLPVVQEICGHAEITTTRRYVHLADTRRRQAIDDLGTAYTKRRTATGRKVRPEQPGA
ncbi:MAG: tyrosine-type recombinase/integrase [Myxococcales bacterium]|nr:tyrosine-type recombinase/integrase [Myxococcales bacterium]